MMKPKNKSEVFKLAWKVFRANKKMTFSEALSFSWNSYRVYKRNQKALQAKPSKEEQLLAKASSWARRTVSETMNWDHGKWFDYYKEHKNEGTVWQLAARFARIMDREFRSFC